MFTKIFRNLSKNDVALTGGKGASLCEMTQAGIPVPLTETSGLRKKQKNKKSKK